jgi:two-component system, response regulator
MKAKNILLVEDNPDDIKLTLRAFMKCGITNPVEVIQDGAEALDYLFAAGAHGGRDPADLPTVVILDLNLPTIAGLDVLARLRADDRTRLVPVVILTSSKDDEHIIASYDLGANSFVRKPIDQDEFIKAVHQLGLYWMLLNEPPPKSLAEPD